MATDWSGVSEATRLLLREVRGENFVGDEIFHKRYAEAYTAWADLAEQELMDATVGGHDVRKAGLRGRAPVLVWRSMQSERPPAATAAQLTLDEWRATASLVNELRCILYWMTPGGYDDDAADNVPGPGDGRDGVVGARWEGSGVRTDVPCLIDRLAGIRDQIAADIDEGDTSPAEDRSGPDADLDDHDQQDGDPAPRRVALGAARRMIGDLASDIDYFLHATAAPTHGTAQQHDGYAELPRLLGAADDIYDIVQEQLRRVTTAESAARTEAWKRWVSANISNGAMATHDSPVRRWGCHCEPAEAACPRCSQVRRPLELCSEQAR